MNNPLIFIDPDGRGVETTIVNSKTNESVDIDDGYTFTMTLSDDQYNAVIENALANGAENAFSSLTPGSEVSGATHGLWTVGASLNGAAQGVAEIPGALYNAYAETGVEILAAWLVGRGMMKSKPLTPKGPWKGPANYSHIKDPKNLNASTKPTPRQRREMLKANREHNGGTLRDDVTGEKMVPSQKSVKGVTPPPNEAQIDHKKSVKNGGTRTNSNLHLRTRKNNRDKWHN